MRVAVVSDIHGNYHALEAVLAEVLSEAPDELWCLGDVVGYGPEPNRCCEQVERDAALCLAGNHDLAVIGALPIDDFNGDAADAVRWTQAVLADAARRFLEPLVPAATRYGAALFHGSPIDPVWDYVLSEEGARASMEMVRAPLLMVGHSHVALSIAYDRGALSGGLAHGGDEVDLNASRWLLNPGSVGQPRGGDPRAAWLMLDFDAGWAWFRRTEYPIERTQAEIRTAGLPEGLAGRLAHGLSELEAVAQTRISPGAGSRLSANVIPSRASVSCTSSRALKIRHFTVASVISSVSAISVYGSPTTSRRSSAIFRSGLSSWTARQIASIASIRSAGWS